jgi:hypothetical protein
MLRISLQESADAMVIKLEGRFALPYVGELSNAWLETAPLVAKKKLSLDLTNLTHVDAVGSQTLRGIYSQTHAELLTDSPSTQSLAQRITHTGASPLDQELWYTDNP